LLTKSGAILIQREDKKSLIELLKAAKDRIDKGKKIVIFPEGTRNKNPKKLLNFKPGAKFIAEKYNFSIQPLLLLGIDEIVKFNPLNIKKGKLTVIALPSIKVQKGSSWYEDLKRDMQKEVDKFYKNKM
jgi:1-acyl-sn-glycerol-3-phosphate acyltransferase